jgi:hypothetical protein
MVVADALMTKRKKNSMCADFWCHNCIFLRHDGHTARGLFLVGGCGGSPGVLIYVFAA